MLYKISQGRSKFLYFWKTLWKSIKLYSDFLQAPSHIARPFLFYFFSFWIFLFATQDLRALKGKYGKDNIFPQDNQSPFLRRGNNFIFLARTRMQRWQECFNLKTFSEMLWKYEIFLVRTRMQGISLLKKACSFESFQDYAH